MTERIAAADLAHNRVAGFTHARELEFAGPGGGVVSAVPIEHMILAVAVGVAFQIPNSANLAGYEKEILRQGVTAGFGDVRVRPKEGREFANASQLVRELRARPDVRTAVPILMLAGAVRGDGGFEDAMVIGLDRNADVMPYALLRGEDLHDHDEAGLVIGSSLAKRIGVDAGSEIQVRVFLTIGADLLGEDAVGRYTMKVRGVASGGFVAPSAIFLDRGFLSSELGSTDAASRILVHGFDHDSARELADHIARDNAKAELRAVAWDDDNPFLGAAVKSSATISVVSYAMVMIAIVIPVWALLYIGVLHRQRQIALMISIGFTRRAVFGVFLLQAFVLGLIGVALGTVGGVALVSYFDAHPIFKMDAFTLRPALTLRTYLEPALIILAATIFAGIWPAHRASRLEPSRVLRGAR